MKIKIKSNVNEMIQKLNIFQLKQIPFVFKNTVNKCLQEAREGVVEEELKKKFTLRKDWYKENRKFGFRIKYATKNRLSGMLYTKAYWMGIHRRGGIKKPSTASMISIPTDEAWKDRSKVLPKRMRIQERTKKSFFIKRRDVGDIIFTERVGSRKKRKKRKRSSKGIRRKALSKIRVLYVLKNLVHIKRRFKIYNRSETIISSRIVEHFKKYLTEAIKTSK